MNYQNIRLDKSMYKADGGFSKQLERMDPSENYVNTPLEELDAFQRQLKRFDIKISGKSSDKISKFFATSDSAALFPEYVSRAITHGVSHTNDLRDIIASTSVINSLDYRAISADIQNKNNPEIPEGGIIPENKIILNDSLIRLIKRGQMISASYEAIKHQRADVITVALSQIGQSLARTQFGDALRTLIEGNSTGVPPAKYITVSAPEFTYEHLLDLWCDFDSFELTTIAVSPNTMRHLLTLPEFRESTSGDKFVSTGTVITPFGAKLIASRYIDDEVLLGIDKNYALEMVTTGGVIVEHDKLIDTQLERAAVTTTYGFSKLFSQAAVAMVRE